MSKVQRVRVKKCKYAGNRQGGGTFQVRVGPVLTQHMRGPGGTFHRLCWGRVNTSNRWCVVENNTIQHNTTQHNTTQPNTTQHNTTQHNTTCSRHREGGGVGISVCRPVLCRAVPCRLWGGGGQRGLVPCRAKCSYPTRSFVEARMHQWF